MFVHISKVLFLSIFVLFSYPISAKKSAKDLFLIGFEADRNFMQENKLEHYLNRAILKLEELKPHLLVGVGLDLDKNGTKDTYLEVFGWSMDASIKESTDRGYGVSEDLGFLKETIERQQHEEFSKIENSLTQIDRVLERLRERLREAEQKKRVYKSEACSAYVQSKILSQTALNRNLEGAFLPALVFGSACEKLVCYDPGESESSIVAKKDIEDGAQAALAAAVLAEEGKDGVPKDLSVAYLWNLRAANGKNPDAMYQTALRLKAGIGIPKDEVRSENWRRAGESKNVSFNGMNFSSVKMRKGRKKTYVTLEGDEYEIKTEHDDDIDYDYEYIIRDDQKYLTVSLNDQLYVADEPLDERYALDVNGQKIYYKIVKDEDGQEKKVFELNEDELQALHYLYETKDADQEKGCCERSWCCCCPSCGSSCDRFKNRLLFFLVGSFSTAIASTTSVVTAYSKIENPDTANMVVWVGMPATVVASVGAGIISAWYTNNKALKKKEEKEKSAAVLEQGRRVRSPIIPGTVEVTSDHSSHDALLEEPQSLPKSTVIEIYEDSDSDEDIRLQTPNEVRLQNLKKHESIDESTALVLKKKLLEQNNGTKATGKTRFQEIARLALEKSRNDKTKSLQQTKEEDVKELLESMKPGMREKAVLYMKAKVDLAKSHPTNSSNPPKKKVKLRKRKPLKATSKIAPVISHDDDDGESGDGSSEGPLEIEFGSQSSGDD